MATIRPFRALRPTPEVADRTSAVPYDVVNVEEARALAGDNPLSFLHVSRAEIDLAPGIDVYSDGVYTRAAGNFAALREAAPLVDEREPAVYFYRLKMGRHEQTGIAACYSVDEYDRDVIKKHERTRRDKEDDRTRHIIALRAQTGPVFLTYRASEAIGAVTARVTARPPLFDFTAADGVSHTVWPATGEDLDAVVSGFSALPCLYIADGHHRAASAARARRYLAEQVGAPSTEADYFLAVAFPDDEMNVLPYNRVVKDLAGRAPEAFLAEVQARFRVEPGEPTPPAKGIVEMYLGGRWYRVHLRRTGGEHRAEALCHDGESPSRDAPSPQAETGSREAEAPSPRAETGGREVEATSPQAETGSREAGAAGRGADVIGNLDVSILQERLLAPVLGIADPRTDKRIDFVGGIRGTGELVKLVDGGKAAVAFSMFPVSVGDLMAIADAGEIMPPKSTWFEPKLRDGLLIHLI